MTNRFRLSENKKRVQVFTFAISSFFFSLFSYLVAIVVLFALAPSFSHLFQRLFVSLKHRQDSAASFGYGKSLQERQIFQSDATTQDTWQLPAHNGRNRSFTVGTRYTNKLTATSHKYSQSWTIVRQKVYYIAQRVRIMPKKHWQGDMLSPEGHQIPCPLADDPDLYDPWVTKDYRQCIDLPPDKTGTYA